MTSLNPPLKEVQEARKRKWDKNALGGISFGGVVGFGFWMGWSLFWMSFFGKLWITWSLVKNNSMKENKKSLTCQGCQKWKSEENLLITAEGSYCEECYHESKN